MYCEKVSNLVSLVVSHNIFEEVKFQTAYRVQVHFSTGRVSTVQTTLSLWPGFLGFSHCFITVLKIILHICMNFKKTISNQ